MDREEVLRRAEKEYQTALKNKDAGIKRRVPEKDLENLIKKVEYRGIVLHVLREWFFSK